MEADRVVKITGDPESPISRGYLCPKGAASPQLLYHPDRLKYPLRRKGKRGENKWERISWDEALDEISNRFARIKAESGPEFVAIAQGTGRPLIDFSVRFANAFGTPNFVSVPHVCYAPRVAASGVTLGQMPVTDVYGFGGKDPECFVIWGCNITHSASADGMCGGTIERALKKAKKVIVIDPRRIKPADTATHWLQIRPGADGALALAMIHYIIEKDLIDDDFVNHYTSGYDRLVEHVKPFTPEWASHVTRIPRGQIRAAAFTYATTKPACMLWGSALDASACNFQTARSLLILRALTGNIDCPGGDALWVPPEDMYQKSIFMNPEQEGTQFLPEDKKKSGVCSGKFAFQKAMHPPSFWKSIVTGSPYRIRGMWIAASNPLVSQTHPLVIEKALRDNLEFTVVSEYFMTPTAALADLVLPSAMWLETDDIANLHKIWCVLARKKVAQTGEVRDVKEVFLQVAKRLNMDDAFPWENYHAFLDWVLEKRGISFNEFCDLGIIQGDMRYYKYKEKGFQTPSGKFEIYSHICKDMGLSPLPVYREPALSPVSSPKTAEKYPLILSTGARAKVYFVSEGRQIKTLRKINPDPMVEIHPDTAESLGIQDGDWVWIETVENRVQMRAKLFNGIAPDVASAQHAWWFPEEGPPGYGWKKSNINLLLGDAAGYDPETGSESLRSSLCKIYKML